MRSGKTDEVKDAKHEGAQALEMKGRPKTAKAKGGRSTLEMKGRLKTVKAKGDRIII